jgi:hypothetical protein
MIVSECHGKPAEDWVKELETHIEKSLGQGGSRGGALKMQAE